MLRINIANPDEKRNDSVPIAARTWTVAMLRRAYREAIFLKPMNRSLRDWAWWFKYTNVVFYFNKVKLEDNFTLAHYKIRPGRTEFYSAKAKCWYYVYSVYSYNLLYNRVRNTG